MPSTSPTPAERRSVELKDPVLAAFLAWALPGLGHLYQGRMAKAGLFFVCIMGTFLYGVYLSSDLAPTESHDYGYGRAVYFVWREDTKRLAYLCQAGVGLPAMPALIQWNRMSHGKPVLWNGLMAPPRLGPLPNDAPNHFQPTEADLTYVLYPYIELGKTFTMIAGLLNILAVYDAFAGPVFIEVAKKEEDAEDEKGGDEEDGDEDGGSDGSPAEGANGDGSAQERAPQDSVSPDSVS